MLVGRALNDPKMIQKLADSWPIRSAAKATARTIVRGQKMIEEELNKPKVVNKKSILEKPGFAKAFQDELKKEIEREFKQRRKP